MADETTVNHFDRMLGMLHGLPDVVSTRQSIVRTIAPIVGTSQTFIVQTYRQTDASGSDDTIFLECVMATGTVRLVLPPGVADVIARQRDQLGSMNRRKSARRVAADRKAAGIKPAFLKRKGA